MTKASVEVRIPVYKPSLSHTEKAMVMDCLDTEWISSRGPFVDKFELGFADFVGARHAIAVNNGTTALHVALLALGIGPGDEVIVPTLTYVASANAITYTGATPVFVDSDIETWNLDANDVQRVITPRTRAIMLVHLYGQPCDIGKYNEIAEAHNILLIEDCAEAIGAFCRGRHVGTESDIATFSFYGNKTITTGEGGMVVTQSPNLAEKVQHLKGQGLAKFREYWHDIVGYNYRMTNICAAIGYAQLERIQTILTKKKAIDRYYRERLALVANFQKELDDAVHGCWMTSAVFGTPRIRDRVRSHLSARGIETRPIFYPVHSMPMYSRSYRRMPNADELSSRGLTLPSFPDLTESQLDYICNAVLEVV